MVWIAGGDDVLGVGQVWLIETASGARRWLGQGRLAGFVDDDLVGITNGNMTEVIDLTTGDRSTVDGIPYNSDFSVQVTPDGYELRHERIGDEMSVYSLIDPADGRLLLRFDAYSAVPAGPGMLAIATPPEITQPEIRSEAEYEPARGTLNVFLIDVRTGAAAFVATSSWVSGNWPLVANERFVAWTERYCDFRSPGRTRVYARASGRIDEFDRGFWLDAITVDDVLVAGAFGAKDLIALMPPSHLFSLHASDTQASEDRRYISAGRPFGHGGLCP
jgi:hypothetical protein